MKFNVNQQDLQQALNYCQGVIEKRSTLPILSNILIEADDNTLTLSATDMDISIKETITCNIIDSGSTTLNAQMIFDIIKKLPDTSEIEFISNDGKILTIRSNVSKFSLSCLPKDEFPLIETKTNNSKKITVKAQTIFNLINKTNITELPKKIL